MNIETRHKSFYYYFFGAATPGVFIVSAIIARKNIVYGQGPIAWFYSIFI